MLHKARLFLSTVAVTLFLVACNDAPIEETSTEEGSTETTEVQTDNESEVTEAETAETTSSTEEIETETAEETTEETAEVKSETNVEANSSVEEDSSDVLLESIDQAAIDQFVATTGLNIENYTFSFETTDEFVEITVYEKQENEQAHTPLAGIYRYMLDSEDILIQDYLTGAFIPYEEAE
jgi:hypothetical protein